MKINPQYSSEEPYFETTGRSFSQGATQLTPKEPGTPSKVTNDALDQAARSMCRPLNGVGTALKGAAKVLALVTGIPLYAAGTLSSGAIALGCWAPTAVAALLGGAFGSFFASDNKKKAAHFGACVSGIISGTAIVGGIACGVTAVPRFLLTGFSIVGAGITSLAFKNSELVLKDLKNMRNIVNFDYTLLKKMNNE